MIGKKILHYKILTKLGEGGMGIVYKAEDTRLKREVALKFLPINVLQGQAEKDRFTREAQAAAALNHPNISHIYAIEEFDGQMFIAMEYIEGQDLAGTIRESPLRMDDAIKYVTQIAAGLQTAHEKGVIHRDIKSANVMVTEKGIVKIMDFGLAKLANRSKMTIQGSTLGTAAYMSPEQARGEELDKRSDIWSLGVVLYEMISGQLPFKGDYEQAVIYSILNEEPEPLTALRSGLPIALDGIIAKALAKDPAMRYQHVDELPADLKAIDTESSHISRISTSRTTSQIGSGVHRKNKGTAPFSFKPLLKIAAWVIPAVVLTWLLKPGSPPPKLEPVHKMVVPLPEDVIFAFSNSNRMAISPDGTTVVYMGKNQGGVSKLFLKRARNFDTIELAGTEFAAAPFFSPDGRWIGYFDGRRDEIYKVLADGGEPLMITSFNSEESGATWAPDNTIIFPGDGVLKRVQESGGEATILTKTKRLGELHSFPHMLPDGKTVLFTIMHEGAPMNTFRLATYSLGDDDYRIILDEEGYNAVYSTTGHILYGRANRLMAVPFDLKTLKVAGVSVPVVDNVQTNKTWAGMSYALAADGTLIYVPDSGSGDDMRSVLQVSLSGKVTSFFDLKKEFELARYSPDGRYVAFHVEEDNADNNWIYHVGGGALNQITFYKQSRRPWFAWSPDSKTIAYATMFEDSSNSIYIKNIDGTGTAQKIFTAPDDVDLNVVDWSSDGDKLLCSRSYSNWDIFVYSFTDSSMTPLLATPAYEFSPEFSPNGKWVVYLSNESGNGEVYVRPYPKSSGGVWKISNGDGWQPTWSPDGKKIYYESEDAMYSVDVTATDTFSKGNPEKIFEGDYFSFWGRRWDIHPDGDKFIMIQRPEIPQEERKIYVIQNFSEELKRLAPVGKD